MPPLEPLPPTDEFRRLAAEIGVELDPDDLRRLGLYLALLYRANESFNLTAVRDPAEGWIRHVLDSLTLLPLLVDLPPSCSVIDVGSGGGAPALPLAIALPDLRFTLVESTGKKARFLEETAAAIGLPNVAVVNDRAEILGHDVERHRERHDAALARAVGHTAVVAELCSPLVKVGGLVLLSKGQKALAELDEAKPALHALHLALAGVVDTPTGKIVALEKRRKTPRIYPRKPGEPARAPLGVKAPPKPAPDSPADA